MASLPLEVELEFNYRAKILFHFIVFWREEGAQVLKALNYVFNFKKIIASLSFSLYIMNHVSRWKGTDILQF